MSTSSSSASTIGSSFSDTSSRGTLPDVDDSQHCQRSKLFVDGAITALDVTPSEVMHGSFSQKLLGKVDCSLDGVESPSTASSASPKSLYRRTLSEKDLWYVAQRFEGKQLQMEKAMLEIRSKGLIPSNVIKSETDWFYNDLGIDDMYFQTETVDAIVSHLHSLYAAKVAAYARDENHLDIRLASETDDHAIYIDTSLPGVSVANDRRYEQRIDERYLNGSTKQSSYRVETFRSDSVLSGGRNEQTLRCYFVHRCDFPKANIHDDLTGIDAVGEHRFLAKATAHTREVYGEILQMAAARAGPVIEVFDIEGTYEKRVVIAYKQQSTVGIFSAFSDLYHHYGLSSSRKYVEQFSNGYSIMSVYLRPAPPAVLERRQISTIEDSIRHILRETSLLYCIPQNRFQSLFTAGELSLQETIYAHCVWIFAGHLLNRLGSEVRALSLTLDPANSMQAELLAKLTRRLRVETFTSDYILSIMSQYPGLIRGLYHHFAACHRVEAEEDLHRSMQRSVDLHHGDSSPSRQLQDQISEACINEHHELVMSAFHTFNKSVLKTNFYTTTKTALSFRLDPGFLPAEEYPQPLFGMFLVVGSEFRGFHLRFRDIARGGIRIVKSRDQETYAINQRSLFNENYNLACTQQCKNKDIPEGGSKGVILLDHEHQGKSCVAFEKYIDSLLDLTLPGSDDDRGPIVDRYGREEILFMGPDENTAELVDWATEHARARGSARWRSFFTGKSSRLGGIPHDKYGMTTLSVREFVLGIYRKLNIDPESIRKLQTGGPDGDLGSNEILLANEKYTAIVDGAGVLFDPQGIDRAELVRLAESRATISDFDTSRLSAEGYRVLIDDMCAELPSGEIVNNCTAFRNTFHLRQGQFDLFVPCGGRPESVDISTVGRLIQDGECTIPYIVEGANLFLTQDAKLQLESAGCVVFKDASANKGGVTSSSLEVLASLSFDEVGFLDNMCVRGDGSIPAFYHEFVAEVQEIIKRNARLEFEAIWKEHAKSGEAKSILSDRLSSAIVDLDEELQESDLWRDAHFRRGILMEALPQSLVNRIGFDVILSRVPENYLRAVFGSFLASRFIYQCGINAGQFAFYSFIRGRQREVTVGVRPMDR